MDKLTKYKVVSCGWQTLAEALNDAEILEFYWLHTITEASDGTASLYTLIWELRELRDPDAPTD